MLKGGLAATSKSSLKLQCLFAAKGDIKEAKELYDFLASDLTDLPDHDPVKPTWVDNTKDAVTGFFGWLKENQDTLAQSYDFVRGLIGNRGVNAVEEVVEELPKINE